MHDASLAKLWEQEAWLLARRKGKNNRARAVEMKHLFRLMGGIHRGVGERVPFAPCSDTFRFALHQQKPVGYFSRVRRNRSYGNVRANVDRTAILSVD